MCLFLFNYVVPSVSYFIVMRAIFVFRAFRISYSNCTQVLTRYFVTYLNINYIYNRYITVKSSFATEDDMRMSKHVL